MLTEMMKELEHLYRRRGFILGDKTQLDTVLGKWPQVGLLEQRAEQGTQ